MGVIEWIAAKISHFLRVIEPSMTGGILIIWAGGLYAMSKTQQFTESGILLIPAWSVVCIIFYMLAWGFRVDAGLIDNE